MHTATTETTHHTDAEAPVHAGTRHAVRRRQRRRAFAATCAAAGAAGAAGALAVTAAPAASADPIAIEDRCVVVTVGAQPPRLVCLPD